MGEPKNVSVGHGVHSLYGSVDVKLCILNAAPFVLEGSGDPSTGRRRWTYTSQTATACRGIKTQYGTIWGSSPSGVESSRHNLVFGGSIWIRTMMQPCASAAKLRGGAHSSV